MGRLWVFRVFVFEKSDISAVVKNVSGSKKKKKSLKVPYDYWPWKWVIWYCINMFSAGRKVIKLVQNFERNHVFSCLELVSLYEGKNQCGCSRQLTFWYYLSVYVFAVRIILDPYFALLRASVLSDPLYVDCRAVMGSSLKLKNTSVKVLSDQLKSLCHNN